ncbi:MAG: P1 family peptidase, partial [Boseongicola sp.]|nr:P1 family peptidase [Boseongicola sp.]
PRTKLDSPGNTTIAIVATDATLTKAGATRMAVAAHDGMARAIVPSHTPMDGDLVFAASTGQKELTLEDHLLLGHTAATCLARAIARGVYNATAAPDDPFPTWADRFG